MYMFPRFAAIVLVASASLSGTLAKPMPAPTPAPVLVERLDLGDTFKSLRERSGSGVENIWY